MASKVPLVVIVGSGFGRLAAAKALRPDLTVQDHPEIFVIRDTASLDQVAMQQGRYAAKSIFRRVTKKSQLPPFPYFNEGHLAAVRKNFAALQTERHDERFFGLARLGVDPRTVSGREQLEGERLLPVGLDIPQCKAR
ncbi:hypothetical protein FTW19_13165 [Terriglobus albidus]|uniref:FAD/NAD(P)-binding domain-containing protein n=1 Tax=Terriglobus albidus TaxID=1592106 RepID=A0A5B9EB10_9BACT|nr:hypothetical protein [Terriglobus albidus]QEE28864.1 hypothetical protein FTW19_13165 [Terriglobus albidus]